MYKISGGVFWMIEIKALFLIYNYSVKLIKKHFFRKHGPDAYYGQ